MEASLVCSTEEFYKLKEEWNNLLSKSDSNVIFLRWEWLYPWWLVYGGGSNRLCLVVVREKKDLLGVAPFYQRKGKWRLPSEIRFLGSNVVCSDYLDFILLKGREKEILDILSSFLKSRSDLWDRLILTDIPLKSENIARIRACFGEKRMRDENPGSICPYIDLTSSWDNVFSSYSSVLKNIIKRKGKQFEADHEGKFIEIDSSEDIDFYFFEMMRLQKLRMNQKKMISPFLDPKFVHFHHSVLKSLYKNGNMRLMFLKIREELIAAIYLLIDNNTFYYYQSGFDPAWERLSPGTLLFHYAIKAAYERGMKQFDFLQGDEGYKSSWTRSQKVNVSVSVYHQSFRGKMVALMDDSRIVARKKLKTLLGNVFVKERN